MAYFFDSDFNSLDKDGFVADLNAGIAGLGIDTSNLVHGVSAGSVQVVTVGPDSDVAELRAAVARGDLVVLIDGEEVAAAQNNPDAAAVDSEDDTIMVVVAVLVVLCVASTVVLILTAFVGRRAGSAGPPPAAKVVKSRSLPSEDSGVVAEIDVGNATGTSTYLGSSASFAFYGPPDAVSHPDDYDWLVFFFVYLFFWVCLL